MDHTTRTVYQSTTNLNKFVNNSAACLLVLALQFSITWEPPTGSAKATGGVRSNLLEYEVGQVPGRHCRLLRASESAMYILAKGQ